MSTQAIAARRFPLIDSIRGIAALAVAGFHFYGQLDSGNEESAPLWGRPLHTLLIHGDLGVYVFFALSGFVIACSLHAVRINAGVVGRFALKRSLRLDPAYWITIAITLLAFTVASDFGRLSSKGLFSIGDVLANMFYMNRLLHCRAVVSVGWTLCLEIQLYLVFILLEWAACAVSGRAVRPSVRLLFFGVPTIWSLLVFAEIGPLGWTGVFVPYWFMYFLGVVTWWTLSGVVSARWLWCTVAASAMSAVYMASIEAGTAIATVLAIYAAARLNRLDNLLSGPVFQYFGRISYSFYLIHALVGNNLVRLLQRVVLHWQGGEFNFGRGFTTDHISVNGLWSLLIFMVAMAASVAAAHMLYKIVESPSHRLSRRIRLVPDPAPAKLPAPLETAVI